MAIADRSTGYFTDEAKNDVGGSGGVFTFCNKESDKEVYKLIWSGVDEDPYIKYERQFEDGKPAIQYVMKAVKIDGANVAPTILVLKRSQISQIIEQSQVLQEEDGGSLLNAQGYPVICKKAGTGMQTKYKVVVSRKLADVTQLLDDEIFDKPLVEYVADLTKPTDAANKGKKKGKQSFDVDEDELFDE